jgi:predicted transcriptional regulator
MEKEEAENIINLKNRPLERVFQNNIARILDFFIYNQNFDFSTSEISEISEVPLRTVQRIIPQLVKKELVKEVKVGKKNKTYELNKSSELAEVLNRYSIATLNSFIKNAKMINQKDRKIIPLSNIIQEQS